MSDVEFDILYKVILVGDPAVGKTNILSRFTKDEFLEDTRSTVGVEFSTKLFEVGDRNIKVNIWDTAGQERFRSITLSYYKGSKGAIIVYDVSRRETFEHIDKWHKDITENTEENISVILVGNKCDLETRNVTTEEAQEKAKNLNCAYIETSALKTINIELAFNTMVEKIVENNLKQLEDLDDDDDDNNEFDKENFGQKAVNLNEEKKQPKKKGCC